MELFILLPIMVVLLDPSWIQRTSDVSWDDVRLVITTGGTLSPGTALLLNIQFIQKMILV